MALEKTILKSETIGETVYNYQPREISKTVSSAAIDYVHDEKARMSEFQMSELVAQQSGVSRLEDERSQGILNDLVLEKLKEVQERAYKEAYDLGHEEGAQKAFQEQSDALKARLQSLDTLLTSIEAMKRNLLQENEGQFVQLTFEIAKRLAFRDLSEHKDAVARLLQEVVADMQQEQQVVVNAASEDIPAIEELQKRTDVPIEILKKIKLVADDSIQSGGCMIDLKYGQVDLTLQDRVKRIWETLEKQIFITQKSS